MVEKIEMASELGARGFRVFPLRPNSKVPAVSDWQSLATVDADAIQAWWQSNPDYNVGVATGGGLLVVDVDVKGGNPGADSLIAMESEYGLPRDGFRVTTPSGGTHIYLRTETPYRNSVNQLEGFPGIDIRCEGGLVAAPGSTIDGKPYEIAGLGPMQPVPPFLHDILQTKRVREQKPTASWCEPDLDHNVERAREWLVDHAPTGESGNNGNNTLVILARTCRDFGLSEDRAIDIILDDWNPIKAEPQWVTQDDLTILDRTVRSAYRKPENDFGCKSVEADEARQAAERAAFGTIDLGEDEDDDPAATVKAKKPRWTFETEDDLRQLPRPKWIVENWIPENATGIVYGKWGSGKTFFMFDMVLHLAHGMADWHGTSLPGEAMKVLVVSREGHQGFADRIEAFRTHHRIEQTTSNLVLMRAPLNIGEKPEFDSFTKELQRRKDGFRLIVLDTVARVLPGVDMNAPENITNFMDRCGRLTETLGATTIGVHHQNKGGSLFGSIFFEANSDFVFEISRDGPEDGPLSTGHVFCAKMKDGPDRWRRELEYCKIALDDPEGKRSSLILANVFDKAAQGKSGNRTRDLLRAYSALVDAYRLGDRWSHSPRATTRFAAAKIAVRLGIDQEYAAALMAEMLQTEMVKKDFDKGTKAYFLRPTGLFDFTEDDAEMPDFATETSKSISVDGLAEAA